MRANCVPLPEPTPEELAEELAKEAKRSRQRVYAREWYHRKKERERQAALEAEQNRETKELHKFYRRAVCCGQTVLFAPQISIHVKSAKKTAALWLFFVETRCVKQQIGYAVSCWFSWFRMTSR